LLSHGWEQQENEPSSFPLLILLLELVKDAGHFIGSLRLLKKGHEPKRVHGHRFVLKLMCLGLRKKDLFAFLLCCGKLHCSMEVAAVEVAKELHSTPHKLMHQHEHGILGNAKPTN
jgi:hypothetical protein